MATKKKYQVGAFNTISLVDLLTGALGAVIALFAMVPKMQMSEMTQGGTVFLTLPIAYDQYNRILWGETPDSLRNFAIKEGDTLTVVVTSQDLMPKDTVYADVGGSSTAPSLSRRPYTSPVSVEGEKLAEAGDCLLSPTFSDFVCDDKSTPSTEDDTFTATLNVKASRGGRYGWVAKLDGRPLPRGEYDVPLKIGPLPIRKTPYTLEIMDTEQSKCVLQSSFASPSPCSTGKTEEPTDDPNITGDAVVSLTWESIGNALVDLNLIIKYKGMICSGGRRNTPFAEHTTEVGIQEYIRLQGRIRNDRRLPPPAGTYEIYVHNYASKLNRSIQGTVKIGGAKLLISKEITRTFQPERFPGKKIGEIVLDANGKYSFTETY